MTLLLVGTSVNARQTGNKERHHHPAKLVQYRYRCSHIENQHLSFNPRCVAKDTNIGAIVITTCGWSVFVAALVSCNASIYFTVRACCEAATGTSLLLSATIHSIPFRCCPVAALSNVVSCHYVLVVGAAARHPELAFVSGGHALKLAPNTSGFF